MSSQGSSPKSSPDHDFEAYFRVRDKLNRFSKQSYSLRLPVETQTPLTAAINKLSSIPFAKFAQEIDYRDPKLTIGGEAAGTFAKPNVELIRAKSTPSPFGRGEETVMDTTYRQGSEIAGSEITLDDYGESTLSRLQTEVSRTLFIGRTVVLRLYKLAVYEAGGHFKWHRDTTHSDAHHGTLLVALNTEWKGGDLVVRRSGGEMRADMRPRQEEEDGITFTTIQAVAFYTDTEHMVEAVSEGVRVVLQYDIEVEGDEEDALDEEESPLRNADMAFQSRKEHAGDGGSGGNAEVVEEIAGLIGGLHARGVNEVGFPLQYLYRKASIRPGYLKGCDGEVYAGLKGRFDVSVHPVVLTAVQFEGDDSELSAYRFDESGSDSESEGEQRTRLRPAKRQRRDRRRVFYMPAVSAIRQISDTDYIEHTGNSAQPGEQSYFGAGLFVRPL